MNLILSRFRTWGLEINHLNTHNFVWQGCFSFIIISQVGWPIELKFYRFVILCICWDTPTVKASHWHLPIVSSAFKGTLWGICKFVLELCKGHQSKSKGHHGNCLGVVVILRHEQADMGYSSKVHILKQILAICFAFEFHMLSVSLPRTNAFHSLYPFVTNISHWTVFTKDISRVKQWIKPIAIYDFLVKNNYFLERKKKSIKQSSLVRLTRGWILYFALKYLLTFTGSFSW